MSDREVIQRAVEKVWRECRHPALERDDLEQEGWLAVLEAEAASRAPAPGPHRPGYVFLRAAGGMRDARRRAARQIPEGSDDAPELAEDRTDDVIAGIHVREQLRRFSTRREATPAMRQVLHGLVAGRTVGDLAAERGCSTSAVFQIAYRVEWLMSMLR